MDKLSRHERFMQLFLPTQQGLCGYLRTLVPNPSDAEDVLQAAATVMWQKFDEFQPGTRFDHWAYHICSPPSVASSERAETEQIGAQRGRIHTAGRPSRCH